MRIKKNELKESDSQIRDIIFNNTYPEGFLFLFRN